MRLQQLHLLAYGKFSGHTLDFPAAPQDFHLIVGPNEAGKSTTRNAILELLYGIELRSPMDFVHAKADMRLGATVTHGAASLAFVRTKARSKTLLCASTGQPLPDAALAPFLGGADRAFFDGMFGLDHSRLVAGGKAMLEARDDIGQVLFQSAAGIASLGAVRASLAAEADSLWARRKSGDRAWYSAADDLDRADKALKAATVRTRDWQDAVAKVDALQAQRAQSRAKDQQCMATRQQLERVRRVAPALRQWRALTAALAALLAQGALPDLPADAAARLALAELALASAGRDAQWHAAQAQHLAAQQAALQPDSRLLPHAADIQALAARRQQLQHHGRDIDHLQLQAGLLWQQVQALVRQLGLPGLQAVTSAPALAPTQAKTQTQTQAQAQAEQTVADALPTRPARAAVLALAQQHALQHQACQTATAALADRSADLALLDQQRSAAAGLPAGAGAGPPTAPAALRAALAAARALGDVPAAISRDQALYQRCSRDSASAQAALGAWPLGLAALQALALPAEAEVQQHLQQQADAQRQAQALAGTQADLQSRLGALALEVLQQRSARHLVSAGDLAQARALRDGTWAQLQSGALALAAAASSFNTQLQHADHLADQRHDQARDVSTLQVRLDEQQRLQQQATDLAQRQHSTQTSLATLQAGWQQRMATLGLAGLAATALDGWRNAQQRRLAAAQAQAHAQAALQTTQQTATQAAVVLQQAVLSAGLQSASRLPADPATPDHTSLATLVLTASDAVDAAAAHTARRDALAQQHSAAVAALARQQDAAAAAQDQAQRWATQWHSALLAVGLPPTTPVAAAITALGLMDEIEAALQALRQLRQGRIASLQADLADFQQTSTTLLAKAAPQLAGPPASDAVALLAQALAQAQAVQAEADRLAHEQARLASGAQAAAEQVAQTQASLLPLLQMAGLAGLAGLTGLAGLAGSVGSAGSAGPGADPTPNPLSTLRHLIQRADQQRQLAAASHSAQQAVDDAADGLPLATLDAEISATPVAEIPLRLADLDAQHSAERQVQDALTAQLTQAEQALALIAGQDDAARAEADRQDALARMAAAAERYLTVRTADRLLKWAIDRWRETRQGPLLGRASALFAGLTGGAFQRLVVDFDSEPLALHGQRADGSLVGLAGLSEGSRDQLYLALRLAALELHLGADLGPDLGTDPGARSGANAGADTPTSLPGHALPFIADDLFINHDDDRTRAGLAALAQLSRHTQVICLTHHAHLVPLAQSVLGAGVNLLRLPAGRP